MSRSTILYTVLIVSLGINVLLGGMMVGRAIHHPTAGWFAGHHGSGDHGSGDHGSANDRAGSDWSRDRGSIPDGPAPRWMRRMFGDSGKPVLDEAWGRHAAGIDALRETMRDRRTKVREALETRPFDPDAYARSLADMRETRSELRARVHALMVDALTNASDEVREDVTEQVRAWEERRSRRRD